MFELCAASSCVIFSTNLEMHSMSLGGLRKEALLRLQTPRFCTNVLHKVTHVKLRSLSMHVLSFLRQPNYFIIQRIEKSTTTTKSSNSNKSLISIEKIRYEIVGWVCWVGKSTFMWLKQMLNFVIPYRLTDSIELDLEKFAFHYSMDLPSCLLVLLMKLK